MSSIFLRVLFGVLLGVATLPALAHKQLPVHFVGCTLDKTLFFSYTKDRSAAVEVCEVEEGYRYTFGPYIVVPAAKGRPLLPHEHKQLKLVEGKGEQVILEAGEIGRTELNENAGFAVRRGDIFTWLVTDTSGNISLVTATGGWGRGETKNKKAIALDPIGWGYINEIERVQMAPFAYHCPKAKPRNTTLPILNPTK